MTSKTLHDLLGATAAEGAWGDPATLVTGVAEDSRRVLPGNVFVAVPGAAQDGFAHVPDAVRRGAAAVVAERDASGLAPAEIAAAWFDHPARSLRLFGVTGTNGKTTVAHLVQHVLETCFGACGLI